MNNIGDAPCGNCGTHICNIRLVLDSVESDGYGGFWYKTEEGQVCEDCGELLNWYHLPPKGEERERLDNTL